MEASVTRSAAGAGRARRAARPRGATFDVVAYPLAFAGYVALGLLARSWVLNWVVGPLFPVLVLYVVPHALAGARRARSGGP